ncbi:MAG: preprotein translocase subunit SecG [Patescibacteria group bacterium]|jgi:preprotein translocase subunit SecG|nr:preprotein translocase subunit SecG [Patescibacteria group bacterium]
MQIINLSQIIVSVLLIIAILLQSRGSGLSGVFGGGDNIYQTKRGAEKFIFIATIILSIIFFGLAIANILI